MCACAKPDPMGDEPGKTQPDPSAPEAEDDAEGDVDGDRNGHSERSAGSPVCAAVDGERVELTTSDGVKLAAAHYSTGQAGAPGAVLLHMIPPHHDMNNYTPEFIHALVEAGFDVVNVNRRGAPGSEGGAEDAYEGDKGKLDALAGVQFLLDSPCAVDGTKLVVFGASNGTTSMLDYTVAAAAARDPRQPVPAALVFLSGGGYSEKQNRLADHVAALGSLPAYFAYPSKEKPWNVGIEALAKDEGASAWEFHEYDPGDHGTLLFASDPEIVSALAEWAAEAI